MRTHEGAGMLRVDMIEPSRMDEPLNDTMSKSTDVYDEAVRWLMVLRDANTQPTAETRQAFERWLAADPSHGPAFEKCRSDWAALEPLTTVYGPCGATTDGRSAPQLKRQRSWSWSIGMAAALAALVTMGLVLRDRWNPTFETAASTQIAELKTLTMTDGSRIDLNGRSSVRVQYYRGQRKILLDEGEALFDVAKDPDRPFVVDAGLGAVRVMGTAFQVTRDEDRLTVTVIRGQVKVEHTASPPVSVVLSAGQAVSVTAAGTEPIHAIAANTVGTWTKHVLIFDRAPLGEVMTALRRQYRGTIHIDAAASHIPLTAVVQFSDIETTLSALPKTLPVIVEHPLPTEWHVRLAAHS
ncbi:MAG: FecR domain-containing protein [Nitrospira sp.]